MKAHIYFKDSKPYGYRVPKPRTVGRRYHRIKGKGLANKYRNWQKTGIKIVEPEWKAGDTYYFKDGSGQSIIQARELKMLKPTKWKSMSGKTHEDNTFKNTISHYYEGQNDIEFQLVKKGELKDIDPLDPLGETIKWKTYQIIWIPVEEPEKYNQPDGLYLNSDELHYSTTKKHTKFDEQIDKEEIQLKEL